MPKFLSLKFLSTLQITRPIFWLKRCPGNTPRILCNIKLPNPLQFNKNEMLQDLRNDWGVWTLISTRSFMPWIKYLMISYQQLPLDELILVNETMKTNLREASCSSRGTDITAVSEAQLLQYLPLLSYSYYTCRTGMNVLAPSSALNHANCCMLICAAAIFNQFCISPIQDCFFAAQ